jgi:hypothetical protein
MRQLILVPLITILLFCSCKRERPIGNYPPVPTVPTPTVPTNPAVLLKDVVIPNLPSPYYHFEYNATGQLNFASYASDLMRYNVTFNGDKLAELRNNIIINKDRLQYNYNSAGKISVITYADSNGVVYKKITLTYNAQQLTRLSRERKSGLVFETDKTMEFSYHSDGNLSQVIDHRPPMDGHNGLTFRYQYSNYDNKINVDGFMLTHNEFFDHLILLPGVQLLKNNPGKEVRTGDGAGYTVDYTYTFNDRNFPLTKKGNGVFTSGSGAGQAFQTNAIFSYY